jgi:hypothetical protein
VVTGVKISRHVGVITVRPIAMTRASKNAGVEAAIRFGAGAG